MHRYRAILGPFQWPVWVALTSAYLLAIVPLAYTDRLSLRHLIGNYGEIENMFWYVFGTFTNSLSFTGQFSWSNTKKTSTRLLIGKYQLAVTAISSYSSLFTCNRFLLDLHDHYNGLLHWFYYCLCDITCVS